MVRRTHHERTAAMQNLDHFSCSSLTLVSFKCVALGRRRIASKCDFTRVALFLLPNHQFCKVAELNRIT
jgi:hypothetical protein